MFSSVAIVKPDHIGDLVLSAPAIHAISRVAKGCRLAVHSRNVPLAKHLFPKLEIEAIDFPHLSRSATKRAASIPDILRPLSSAEVVVFLRHDAVINRESFAPYLKRAIYSPNDDRTHETILQRIGIAPYIGFYSPAEVWSPHSESHRSMTNRIGLAIGSGFPANKWSFIRWTEFAKRMRARGADVYLVGGPSEQTELALLSAAINLTQDRIILGSTDYAAFLDKVASLDVVIASDGGTGHLCSLAVPVITIAASVPFRRFAPFGRRNRVISLDLSCSPCLNYHDRLLNACFSYECSYGIQADDVLEALDAPHRPAGEITPLKAGASLFYSPSHANG